MRSPGEIAVGEQLEVTVDVDESVASDESVKVGLHKDGTELQAQASSNGDGTYTATSNPDETGEYALYAAVRAEGSAGGYPVSTGIANGQIVTVTESNCGGRSDDGSGSGNDSGSRSSDGSGSDEESRSSDGSGSDEGTSGDDGSSGTNTDGGTTGDGTGDDSTDDDGGETSGGPAPEDATE